MVHPEEEPDAPGSLFADRCCLLIPIRTREKNAGRGALRTNHDPSLGATIVRERRRVVDQFEPENVDEEPDRGIVLVDNDGHQFEKSHARDSHAGDAPSTQTMLPCPPEAGALHGLAARPAYSLARSPAAFYPGQRCVIVQPAMARSGPLLYAHRGASAEQPENTLPSFRRALELGADALETDVHMTRDGHIVLSHDPSALRMAGVNARFRDAILFDIKSWDAGHGFVDRGGGRPFTGKGYRVATLEELLVELPGVPLNIDLKQPYPSIVAPVIDILRRTRSCERVTLASFHTSVMLAVRRAGYPGPTALSQLEVGTLLGLPGPAWAGLWRCLGGTGQAAQIPIAVGRIRLDTPRFIARCRALGMRVDYWTINRPEEARRLLALGADGIMTDDPAAIKPVIDAWRARSAA